MFIAINEKLEDIRYTVVMGMAGLAKGVVFHSVVPQKGYHCTTVKCLQVVLLCAKKTFPPIYLCCRVRLQNQRSHHHLQLVLWSLHKLKSLTKQFKTKEKGPWIHVLLLSQALRLKRN